MPGNDDIPFDNILASELNMPMPLSEAELPKATFTTGIDDASSSLDALPDLRLNFDVPDSDPLPDNENEAIDWTLVDEEITKQALEASSMPSLSPPNSFGSEDLRINTPPCNPFDAQSQGDYGPPLHSNMFSTYDNLLTEMCDSRAQKEDHFSRNSNLQPLNLPPYHNASPYDWSFGPTMDLKDGFSRISKPPYVSNIANTTFNPDQASRLTSAPTVPAQVQDLTNKRRKTDVAKPAQNVIFPDQQVSTLTTQHLQHTSIAVQGYSPIPDGSLQGPGLTGMSLIPPTVPTTCDHNISQKVEAQKKAEAHKPRSQIMHQAKKRKQSDLPDKYSKELIHVPAKSIDPFDCRFVFHMNSSAPTKPEFPKYTKEALQKRSEIRAQGGACVRCRLAHEPVSPFGFFTIWPGAYNIQCSGGNPCERCLTVWNANLQSQIVVWNACLRTKLTDVAPFATGMCIMSLIVYF